GVRVSWHDPGGGHGNSANPRSVSACPVSRRFIPSWDGSDHGPQLHRTSRRTPGGCSAKRRLSADRVRNGPRFAEPGGARVSGRRGSLVDGGVLRIECHSSRIISGTSRFEQSRESTRRIRPIFAHYVLS